MTKRKICYVTFWSPWKSSGVKVWQHHDAVLKYLCKDYNAEIMVGIPPKGPSYLAEVIAGKKSRLMSSVASLPITFFDDTYKGDFDALLLEINELYSVPGFEEGSIKYSADYLATEIERMIIHAKDTGIPIIWYDPDLYLLEGSNGGVKTRDGGDVYSSFGKEMYDKYFHITKSTIMSSMKKHPVDTCVFVPFNVDPESLPTADHIKPKSEREFITRYVGNNYFREHFLPLFDNSSKIGKVEVIGVGWTPFKSKYPTVEFKPKASLTEENSKVFYANSVFGMYGCSTKWMQYEHHTLRVREFLQGGTLIIPENTHIKESLLFEGFDLTTDDILDNPNKVKSFFENLTDESYSELVMKQQRLALNKFSCMNYINDYAKAFEWL